MSKKCSLCPRDGLFYDAIQLRAMPSLALGLLLMAVQFNWMTSGIIPTLMLPCRLLDIIYHFESQGTSICLLQHIEALNTCTYDCINCASYKEANYDEPNIGSRTQRTHEKNKEKGAKNRGCLCRHSNHN